MENHNPPTPMETDMNTFVGHPRLNSMWPYSVPVDKYNHYRNHFHETQAQPVSSHLVSTNEPVMVTSQSTVANSVPVMGTLQTVLTTGLNPGVQTKPIVTAVPSQTQAGNQTVELPTTILTRRRLQDLVREVDQNEQLDDEVEDILLNMADDFVESAITAACLLAKHRKSNTVEVKDLQLHLERNWNMWIPGFGTDELRPYKRSSVTEAHKQRLTLIRKTLKKY